MVQFKIMLSNKKLIDNYDWNGNNPSRWKDSANALCISYNILWKEYKKSLKQMSKEKRGLCPLEFDVLLPALMLLGYAIESFLKAIWVKNGNILAKDGKFEDTLKCKAHDLVAIAKTVQINFDTKEEDILKRLSWVITAIGRYPIGKSLPKIWPFSWSGGDAVIIKKFVDKLYSELNGF